jgi:hypothetical protein
MKSDAVSLRRRLAMANIPQIGSDTRTSLELFHIHHLARLASHVLPNAIFWEASKSKSA